MHKMYRIKLNPTASQSNIERLASFFSCRGAERIDLAVIMKECQSERGTLACLSHWDVANGISGVTITKDIPETQKSLRSQLTNFLREWLSTVSEDEGLAREWAIVVETLQKLKEVE